MKRFIKETFGISLGAAMLPIGSRAIDEADSGPIGKAAKTGLIGGFGYAAAKKFLK